MSILDHLTVAPVPDLSGGGVLLRAPRRSDYEDWSRLRGESRDFLCPWEPLWSSDELTVAAYRARLRRYAQEMREKTSFTFFLFDETGKTLYGGATLGQIRRGVSQSCMLGYWMGERHAGAGLMREAVELLKVFAFDAQSLHRIEAACLPHNLRSTRLLEKCGFRQEGLMRRYLKIAGCWEDHVLYALLAEDRIGSRPSGDRRDESLPAPCERDTGHRSTWANRTGY